MPFLLHKKLYVTLTGLVLTILFTACEKVIDVKLNSADKKYVIDAVVVDKAGECKVLISKTKDFSENSDFAGVSGATVRVTDDLSNSTSFTESAPGIYEAPFLAGTQGRHYQLLIEVDGKTFTASGTMPVKVAFDNMYLVEDDLFSDVRKVVTVEYSDPPEPGNNYRFVQYINDVKGKDIFIRNDEYINGNGVSVRLRYDDRDDDEKKKIQKGDLVRVDMLCITAPAYKFWYSLEQGATGGGTGATPANPVTNIQGGALGYFSVHTMQTRTLKAP